MVRGPRTSWTKTPRSWPVLLPRAGGGATLGDAGGAPVFLYQAIRQFLVRENSRGGVGYRGQLWEWVLHKVLPAGEAGAPCSPSQIVESPGLPAGLGAPTEAIKTPSTSACSLALIPEP